MRSLPLSTEDRLVYDTKQRIALAAVAQAVRKGWLVPPDVCENCGKPPGTSKRMQSTSRRSFPENESLHAVHQRYEQPLSVKWLCGLCHRAWVASERRLPAPYQATPLSDLLESARNGQWSEQDGLSLRAHRAKAGYTQAFLAHEAGVTQARISQIESGQSATPETITTLMNSIGGHEDGKGKRSSAKDDAAQARKRRK